MKFDYKMQLYVSVALSLLLIYDDMAYDWNIMEQMGWPSGNYSVMREMLLYVGILCMMAIMLIVRENIKHTVIVYAATATLLVGAENIVVMDITTNGLFFAMVPLDVFTFMSIFCIVSYSQGFKHNTTRLFLLAVSEILAMLLPYMVYRYLYMEIETAKALLDLYSWDIAFIAIYAVYLLRPEIRNMTPQRELRVRMSRVESSLAINNDAYMPMSEAVKMLGLTTNGWTFLETGPIEKMCQAYIYGPTKRRWCVTVRKWYGEDFLRASISSERKSDGSWGLPFDIVSYDMFSHDDKKFIRIYGHDGMFVQFYLEDPHEEESNAVTHMLNKLTREF